MPKINKFDKALKNLDKVADHASAIAVAAGLISTVVTFVVEMADKPKRKIDISACCAAKHPMSIEEAKDYLEKMEVKAVYIPIKVSEADSKYRNCFEHQVVDITPSSKIMIGEIPQIHYITREVIDKSLLLFEESEQQRIMAQSEKRKRQSERKDKTKRTVSGIIGSMKVGVEKIPSAFRKSDGKEGCDE